MLNFLKSVRRGSANAAPGAAPVATALARVPDGLTVENDVLIGANDRLYIYQGAHKIWDQARGARPIPQEAVNAFDANLRSRRAACERRKIPWCHLLAPDKQTVAHADYPLDEVHSVGRTIDASAREAPRSSGSPLMGSAAGGSPRPSRPGRRCGPEDSWRRYAGSTEIVVPDSRTLAS